MSDPQTVEKWIDALVDVLGGISVQGKRVRAYYLFKKREYPDSLKEFPCWITYIENVDPNIGSAGASWLIWNGTSELHLAAGLKKSEYPDWIKFYPRIMAAFCAHRTLGGLVAYAMIKKDSGIQGPVTLTYGTEQEHPGLLVNWVVKENVSGVFTLGD